VAESPPTLQAFFAAYATRMTSALADPPAIDIEATAAAFASCFVEASPNGVVCGKNDDQFRAVIPKGLEFYRSIGTRWMKIIGLAVTILDDHHAMAKVHWQAFFLRKDGSDELLDFDVIYLVQLLGDQPKIFGYITGDEQKALREKRLLPE